MVTIPSSTSILYILGLASLVRAELHPPAQLLKRDGVDLLKPRIFQSNQNGFSMSYNPINPLGRLLLTRQVSCPSDYAECTNPGGRCCPTSGTCCEGSGCCTPGQFCYGGGCCNAGDFGCSNNSCCPTGATCCSGGGCCDPTDTCTVVDGTPGCCPQGQTCSGAVGGCSIAGYVQCPNDTYCCPAGDACFRDASGSQLCQGGSGAIGAVTTTGSPTPTGSLPASATYSLIPAIPPPSGSQNQSIAANDPRIAYQNGGWEAGQACNSYSMQCGDSGATMTFQFTGNAIFLSVAKNLAGVIYSAAVDGVADTVNGATSNSNSCDIGWSRFGLTDTIHTFQITLLQTTGISPNIDESQFEANGLIVQSANVASDGTPKKSSANRILVSGVEGGILISALSVLFTVVALL